MEVISKSSARFRYSCPLSALQEMCRSGLAHYSPQFGLGNHMWRLHLQHNHTRSEQESFLSVHLQSCSESRILAQFRLTLVSYVNPQYSKSSKFQCTFDRVGSAWGVNQFYPIERLLRTDGDVAYQDEATNVYYFDIEVLLHILEIGCSKGDRSTGSHVRRSSIHRAPKNSPEKSTHKSRRKNREERSATRAGQRHTSGDQGSTGVGKNSGTNSAPSVTRAPLLYPFEHLSSLADMMFEVEGTRFSAHRCVVVARMRAVLPEGVLPLKAGCVVSISVSTVVFSSFLRYVYTEEYPEPGMMSPEELLDLYLLSASCEFYDLCSVCLKYVQPLLMADNILKIVLTRFNAADDVLNALYLRVLLENYDTLIQDPLFEEMPGHLFRRLSLILRKKEQLPQASVPQSKNTLNKQLAWLFETGEYSDLDLVVGPQRFVLKVHSFILASRCILFSQALNPQSSIAVPPLTSSEFDFSKRAWEKLMMAIYTHHLDPQREFSAENVAIVYKMHSLLGMDGQLKKEADDAFNYHNALRMLIYSVKHHVPELHERSMSFVGTNFSTLIREDPQAWELVAELPQGAVLALFRAVVENHR
ncbi:BTB POZ domain [Trypanosoma vivax]|nr:BTB POZ domain [Trypanosoma vivax]